MKLLHVDSSILGQNSASRELSAAIVARWELGPIFDPAHPEICGRCLGNIEGPGEDRLWF